MKTITFAKAIERASALKHRYLLLGNGFSIACKPDIFTYGSLYDRAQFDAMPELKKVFELLGTRDFEVVVRALENAASVLPAFLPKARDVPSLMRERARHLKNLLIETIAENHPAGPFEIPEEKFQSCRKFLGHFIGDDVSGKVYTLNYDLLLYWAIMHDEAPEGKAIPLKANDGFGRDENTADTEYVTWQGESAFDQSVHYLHGALHLFDAGQELQKYTWINTGVRLIDQARTALAADKFPLFVAEGSSAQKNSRIKHHAYLHHNLRSFAACMRQKQATVFVYGHSLADNDRHVLRLIARGNASQIYVSLFGDPKSDTNKGVVSAANKLRTERGDRSPLEVIFFDASSAEVWGS